jgi:hypothetical protein
MHENPVPVPVLVVPVVPVYVLEINDDRTDEQTGHDDTTHNGHTSVNHKNECSVGQTTKSKSEQGKQLSDAPNG